MEQTTVQGIGLPIDQGPVMGEARLIIALKKLYKDESRSELVSRGIAMKYYRADEIPAQVAQYKKDMPILPKGDPIVKVIQAQLNLKKKNHVTPGDMIIFRRTYQAAQSYYARVVR